MQHQKMSRLVGLINRQENAWLKIHRLILANYESAYSINQFSGVHFPIGRVSVVLGRTCLNFEAAVSATNNYLLLYFCQVAATVI